MSAAEHVWHPWSKQGGSGPFVMSHAQGSQVFDSTGRRYLDFTSQLVFTNTGHQHPKVVAAIVNQAERLATASPAFDVDVRTEAARLVAEKAPAGFEYVFFTTGGTEANENAIRAARAVTGRRKIVSFYRSYHGNTTASIAATGDTRRLSNEFATDHVRCFGPHLYRSAFWAADLDQECERALAHLRSVIEFEGPGTIAAILIETVVGSSGVIPPPPGYLTGVRALCDEFDLMLILDEVMVGFGRTGRWLALEHYDVVPDIITVAKGINSGAVPLGAVIFGPRVADYFMDRAFMGGMTYSGHPLACAAAIGAMAALGDGLIAAADRLGRELLGPGLAKLATHDLVGDVRGIGAFWAVELVADKVTKEPLSAAAMSAFGTHLRNLGVLGLIVGNRLHVAPPLVLTDEEADEGLAVIGAALERLGAAA